MNKECTNCFKNKNLNEFYRDNYTKDGYTFQCKECKLKSANIKVLCECNKLIFKNKKKQHVETNLHKKRLNHIINF